MVNSLAKFKRVKKSFHSLLQSRLKLVLHRFQAVVMAIAVVQVQVATAVVVAVETVAVTVIAIVTVIMTK